MQIEANVIKMAMDDINTDVIIAGKHTKTLDCQELAQHLFEDFDPALHTRIQGKILVAGRNFGCGSSREQAPLALKHAGCLGVVACSFARIFYRNAINIALPLVIADTTDIADDDFLAIYFSQGLMLNQTSGQEIAINPLPKIMHDIFTQGGLASYLRENGGFRL